MLASDWQNPLNQFDVNNDGFVAPADVLNIVNYFNSNKSTELPETREPGDLYLDVDGDQMVAPLDALLIINNLYHGEQSPPIQSVAIPAAGDSGPCGFERVSTELATCLNEHIENKPQDITLQFDIAAGDYLLTETVFLFQRSHVRFVGAGAQHTVLRMDETLETTRSGKIDLAFTFNVIDSSWVSVRDLALSGNNLSGQRAVGVCPTAGRHISHVEMANVEVSEFGSYVFIAGRSIPDQSIAARNFSTRPGPARFGAFAEASAAPTVCGGTVSDIALQDSDVSFQDVAFYLVPYSALDATHTTTVANWLAQADDARAANTRFTVTGNTFRASIEGAAVSSAIKAQGGSDLRIKSNTIDANGFTEVFGDGAAINIASNMRDVSIRNNTINFPNNHTWPERGVAIHSGFGQHAQFGVGTNQITLPAQRVEVVDNAFVNSQIIAIDSCRKGHGQADLTAFCLDVDAAQAALGAKYDDILITENTRNGKLGEDAVLVTTLCERGAVSLSRVTCRENVSIRHAPGANSVALPFASRFAETGQGSAARSEGEAPTVSDISAEAEELIPSQLDLLQREASVNRILEKLGENSDGSVAPADSLLPEPDAITALLLDPLDTAATLQIGKP